MTSFLVAEATNKVWCEPLEDSQYFIAPARLTKTGGASKYATVIWTALDLPNANNSSDRSYYHVYQIGAVDTLIFRLSLVPDVWVSIEDICNANSCIIDAYLDNGAIIPRATVWLRQTLDGNVLVCVRLVYGLNLGTTIVEVDAGIQTVPVTLDTNKFFIRFYKNAVLSDPQYVATLDAQPQFIHTLHTVITSAAALAQFVAQCSALQAQYPHAYPGIWVIGGFVSSPPVGYDPSQLGQFVTFTIDATIWTSKTIPLTVAPVFSSTLDSGRSKYLLVTDNTFTALEYFGDLDFYLVATAPNGTYSGLYLNRADPKVVRQVTHNAYAVDVNTITAYVLAHPWLQSGLALSIMYYVRRPGQEHAPPHIANKLHELYKLPYDELLGAMVGTNATVPEWQAANLEHSAFSTLLTVDMVGLTDLLVDQMYGYNAMTEIANPVRVAVNNMQFAPAPALLLPDAVTGQFQRTYYAYDAHGLYLGWGNNTGTATTINVDSTLAGTTAVEAFQGTTSTTDDGCIFGPGNVTDHRLAQFGFRCYACGISGGVPTEDWADITDSSFFTYYPSGLGGNDTTPVLEWNTGALTTANLYPAVKIGGTMLALDIPIAINYPGFINFDVTTTTTWMGTTQTRPQSIPAGILDVYMQGMSLIRDIDYYVTWPSITIVKRPPVAPGQITVQVRCYGHCDPDTMAPWTARESGFVSGGVLSVGNGYTCREDVPVRIVAGGVVWDRNAVSFADSTVGPLLVDGRPYAVTDYYQQIEPYSVVDTMSYFQAARTMDVAAGDYLTSRITQYVPANPTVQHAKWDVCSPFLGGIFDALQVGFLGNGELDGPYTNLDIANWVSQWLYLLPHDPCVVGVSENFVEIYPHQYYTSIQVTNAQYIFLDRLIENYLNNKTSLSRSVVIVG